MSERLKSSGQVSNEEIIDELTRDLKSTLNTDEIGEEYVINPGTSSEESEKAGGDCPQTSGKDIFFYTIELGVGCIVHNRVFVFKLNWLLAPGSA